MSYEDKVAEMLNETTEPAPQQTQPAPEPQHAETPPEQPMEKAEGEQTTSPQEEQGFLFREEDKLTVQKLAEQANQISDPIARATFLQEGLKKIENSWHGNYTQKRQKEKAELEEYKKQLELEAKQAVIDAYQALIQETQTNQTAKVDETELIQQELVNRLGPEVSAYLIKLLDKKTEDIRRNNDAIRKEKEFETAKMILREKTKGSDLPFNDETFALMDKWYKEHSEYEQYIKAMPNPLVALEFIYNQVKSEQLPAIIERKLKERTTPPPQSEAAKSVANLKPASATIQTPQKDDTDELFENISKITKGVYR